MNGNIEAVAEAIYALNPYEDSDDDGHRGPVTLAQLGEIDDGLYSFVYAQARAAIAAMRVPSVAMQLAGAEANEERRGAVPGATCYPCTIWQAMIDAALK